MLVLEGIAATGISVAVMVEDGGKVFVVVGELGGVRVEVEVGGAGVNVLCCLINNFSPGYTASASDKLLFFRISATFTP